jgi:two-component system, NtrC family, sensor histidine kinase KinB
MTALVLAAVAALSGASVGAFVAWRRAAPAIAVARSDAERVLANASDAVIACAADGVTITAWNPAAERLFGWSAEEVVGRRLPTVGDDAASQERADLLDRVRAGEEVSADARRMRRDGSVIDVRIHYSAIRDADGAFAGWMGTVSDVTDELSIARERAERSRLVEQLNEVVADINAELDLTIVLDRITTSAGVLAGAGAAGFALIDDGGAVIASASGFISEWRGYRFAPGEGTFLDAFAQNQQLVVEDYQAQPGRLRVMSQIESAVLTPVRVLDENIGALSVFYETPGRHASDAQLETLRLLAGHAGTAVANARAYGTMARGHALAQEVLDRLADGVAVLDDAGKVTRWNHAAAELTGLASGEVLGRPFPWRTGTRAEPKEHRLRDDAWVEMIATALPESRGSMVVLRDVSRHLALQEARSELLASASHELRTPLTVIGGYARRLQARMHEMDDDERAAALDAIVRKSDVLERTVDRIMSGSLADLGRLDLHPVPIDLAPLLDAATSFTAGTSARHRFVVDVEPNLPSVRADEHAVESVLAQLLENAVKYSPDGGTVTVRATAGRDDVVVSVMDEGIGLRPGDEARVFERFSRGDSSVRGTGLGLFIVRRLVEAQDGRAWAAPRQDARGAVFSFSLPST